MASDKPLAEEMRPSSLENFIGQRHLLADNGILRIIIDSKRPSSLIFYGPPGSGKTTIANIITKQFNLPVMNINGVSFSTKTFRKLTDETKGQSVYIIIDEIHRMNKAQQDALLPFVENGNIYIIGTTTENPSFEVNNALLSRTNVIVFEQLSVDDIKQIIENAAGHIGISLSDDIISYIALFSNRDARQALNIIDNLRKMLPGITDVRELRKILSEKFIKYDKNSEEHFNLISAFHKSVRGSDPDASLFYLARMLSGGEDPLYIARRMIRIASEDIGNADPNALNLAVNAYKTYSILGSPEGELALAQCAVYLALSPKSIAVYNAFNRVMKDAKKYSDYPVPMKLRNAPTKMMKEMGYSTGYRYPPDFKDSFTGDKYYPDEMEEIEYYKPRKRGFERQLNKRLNYFRKLRDKLRDRSTE